MKSRVDFTQGSLAKNIVIFALPIMAGEILQNLYHSVDSLVLGNFVGEVALAAVSISGTLTNLLIGFCNGMAVGSTVLVAKAFGKKDRKCLEDTILHAYTFSIVLGLFLTSVGTLFAPQIVRLCGANEGIYSQALSYYRIIAAGFIFTVVYNNSAGILRAIGDMRTPFIILSISSVLNIILDLVFSAYLDFGIKGVALATVISQFVSVLISFYVINRKLDFRCISFLCLFKEGRNDIRNLVDVGFPSGIQGSLISLSNLFVWRYINMFSTATVAGIGVAQRIDKFISLPSNAFGNTATTMAGQNVGAGEIDRMKQGFRKCLLISVSFSLSLSFIFYFLAPHLTILFNKNPEVLQVASRMLNILMPFYFLNCIRQVIAGVLRARGRSRNSMLLSISGMIVVRQMWLFVSFRYNVDIINVIVGYPIGWFFACFFVVLYYFRHRRELYTF
ncbi:MAG: MATE family efflux transporter [Sphaerochaetaceae bacterium]|nr:MATE family efflux transporter [Sphaerochaetaceae bacterium]